MLKFCSSSNVNDICWAKLFALALYSKKPKNLAGVCQFHFCVNLIFGVCGSKKFQKFIALKLVWTKMHRFQRKWSYMFSFVKVLWHQMENFGSSLGQNDHNWLCIKLSPVRHWRQHRCMSQVWFRGHQCLVARMTLKFLVATTATKREHSRTTMMI